MGSQESLTYLWLTSVMHGGLRNSYSQVRESVLKCQRSSPVMRSIWRVWWDGDPNVGWSRGTTEKRDSSSNRSCCNQIQVDEALCLTGNGLEALLAGFPLTGGLLSLQLHQHAGAQRPTADPLPAHVGKDPTGSHGTLCDRTPSTPQHPKGLGGRDCSGMRRWL